MMCCAAVFRYHRTICFLRINTISFAFFRSPYARRFFDSHTVFVLLTRSLVILSLAHLSFRFDSHSLRPSHSLMCCCHLRIFLDSEKVQFQYQFPTLHSSMCLNALSVCRLPQSIMSLYLSRSLSLFSVSLSPCDCWHAVPADNCKLKYIHIPVYKGTLFK